MKRNKLLGLLKTKGKGSNLFGFQEQSVETMMLRLKCFIVVCVTRMFIILITLIGILSFLWCQVMNFLDLFQRSGQMSLNSKLETIALLVPILIVVLTVNSAIVITNNIAIMDGYLHLMRLRILNMEELQEILM